MRRLAALLLALPALAVAAESRVFVHQVPDAATYETYSRTLNADRFGKFVIDLKTDEIFYFDVNLYRLHADFIFAEFYHRPMRNEDIPEFNLNYEADKPRFIFGYLTHHLKIDQWTYSFWEGDKITPEQIRRVCKKLNKTFFMKKIMWRPDSPLQEKLLVALKDIPTITNDKIYKAASFQSFNNGRAIGKLRVVPPGTAYETLIFDRDEIVILQESYPDIAPVAGIMSTVFSTPLSHVNLRAKEWNIPNAGFKDAGKYTPLNGKMVLLEVTDLDHTLREATPEEVKQWQARAQEKHSVKVPVPNLKVTELRPLDKMRMADVVIYGTKASNLGEIASARLDGIPIPAGFGVGFHYYADHMKRNGLDKELDKILADPRYKTDAAWRKATFEAFKEKIIKAPIDPKALDAIWSKVQKDLGGKGVFVRSSTNAEDLEGFNGAGLYDTIPNVTSKEMMADALRTVWASLWNFHAVEERALYNMDPKQCAVGILVQVGINGTAAGVLITKNLLDPEDDRSYTINAKRGLGLRVVGGTTVPEQVIYDTGNFGTKIISRSDDPTMLVFDDKGGVKEVPNENKGVILTEERARRLSETVMKFVPLFSNKDPLDVEWVMEGEKVWIVQSRPYVSK